MVDMVASGMAASENAARVRQGKTAWERVTVPEILWKKQEHPFTNI